MSGCYSYSTVYVCPGHVTPCEQHCHYKRQDQCYCCPNSYKLYYVHRVYIQILIQSTITAGWIMLILCQSCSWRLLILNCHPVKEYSVHYLVATIQWSTVKSCVSLLCTLLCVCVCMCVLHVDMCCVYMYVYICVCVTL